MKKLLCLSTLFLLIAVQTTQAQTPKTIEGVAIDSKGVPLPDGTKEITFNIYDAIDGDILLWSEQQTVAIKDGRFSASLGRAPDSHSSGRGPFKRLRHWHGRCLASSCPGSVWSI